MKKPKKEKDTGKAFETRRAAFREAKRDHGVPVGKQPEKVIHADNKGGKNLGLDSRNKRLYIFRILLGIFSRKKKREVHIREDKEAFYDDGGSQDQHFNVGDNPVKLKKHYYFKRK